MTAISTHHTSQGGATVALVPYLIHALSAVRAMAAAGERVTGHALSGRLDCSQVTASRYLRLLQGAGLVQRVGGGAFSRFVLVDGEFDIVEADQPPPESYLPPSEWTEERRAALFRLASAGAALDVMVAEIGLDADKIRQQIERRCLSSLWSKAKAAKAKAAAPLRNDDEDVSEIRVSLDWLVRWLTNAGHHVETTGDIYRLNGKPHRTRGELLAHANLLRARRGKQSVVLE